MDEPTIKNVYVDQDAGLVYTVLAFRELTHDEIVDTIRQVHAKLPHFRAKPGMKITLMSTIGYTEGRDQNLT